MKKIIIISLLMGVYACTHTKNKKDKNSAALPTYDADTRGRNTFPQKWQVNNNKLFVFNPAAVSWAAYDSNGDRVMTGGASGGKDYCDDIDESCRTVVGTFEVFRKEGESCYSNTFPVEKDDSPAGGAPMPYCMFFYNGYAIHGAQSVPKANASHGCIRVFPDAARWLNEEFIDVGTKVLVLPY